MLFQLSAFVFFFGKNQFNLAKRLKATQVHDSDTPAFLTEIGGGVGSKSWQKRKTRRYRGYIRCASSRLMGLRVDISNTMSKTVKTV